MSLRTKLMLVALSILVLPWAGWQFVRQMEILLRQGQEQAMLASAEALARGLAARPGRLPPAARESVFRLRELTLELERMRITWNGEDVPLTVTEFWMVHAMVRYPGHVKSRDQLMREAQIVVDDATITSHIKRIRRKFQAVDPAFDDIDTVHGAGYRWRA